MVRLRRVLAAVSAAAASTLIVVACGDNDENSATQPITSATPDSSATNNTNDATMHDGSGAHDAPDGTTAATPTFTPQTGTYQSAICVTITTATPNATIHYTTDESEPSTSSPVYSEMIKVFQTTTVRALAVAPGFTPSGIARDTFTISIKGLMAPTAFASAAGVFNAAVDVTLSTTTSPSVICYRSDGQAPTCSGGTPNFHDNYCQPPPNPIPTPGPATCTNGSLTYTSPIHIEPSVNGTTVRAIACRIGGPPGDVTIATYTFQ